MRLLDVGHGLAAQLRNEMAAQQVLVEPDRLGPEVRAFRDPGSGVLGQGNEPGVGVDPVAVEDVSFGAD